MAELYGITVSTNYADLLGLIIDQNQKFFTKWYIITATNDQKTLNVIKRTNYEHIEVLFFDFKKGGAKFNKGGALQMAQKLVMTNHGEGVNVLIVDSDIYLPDEFGKIYSELTVEPDKLYGISKRIDYLKYSNFLSKTNGVIHCASIDFIGCFQLYKQTANKIYANSNNCGWCDFIFRDIFLKEKGPEIKWDKQAPLYSDIQRIEYYRNHNCVYLQLCIFHLGHDNINWDGRVTANDFINDIKMSTINETTHTPFENSIINESEKNESENKLINRTLCIYVYKFPKMYNILIAKCKFLVNNILEVKLNNHIINGNYTILNNNTITMSFYLHELTFIFTNENKNINIKSINHNINYFGSLI